MSIIGWPEFLDTPQKILQIFGGEAPSLKNLRLSKLEIIWGRSIKIWFIANETPTVVPTRWRQGVVDGVIYIVSASFVKLLIDLPEEFENGAPLMNLEINKKNLRVVSASGAGQVFINIDAWSMDLDAQPYNVKEHSL